MYYVLKKDFDERCVSVSKQPDVKGWAKINTGVSLLNGWPEGVNLEYSKTRPEGVMLTDQIANNMGWLIVNEKFKQSLEELHQEDFEFLPVGFLDHKGRAKTEPYWIVNFTKLHPAVNLEQSVCEESIGDTLDFFEKLVLTDEIEKNGPPIFCMQEQPTLFLFRQDYKEKIEKLGLTGFHLIATDEFKSID